MIRTHIFKYSVFCKKINTNVIYYIILRIIYCQYASKNVRKYGFDKNP